MPDGALEIPRACLQICPRIEELVDMEIGDLVFTRPFVSSFFGYLHEAALSMTPILSRIKPALTPNDRFHQHRIQVMFNCHRANEAIVLLKPRRAHPFVKRVKRIPGNECEIGKARSERQHHAQDKFEQKPDHSVRATIIDYDYQHESEHERWPLRGKNQLRSGHCRSGDPSRTRLLRAGKPGPTRGSRFARPRAVP